jgi:hypothetical protein
LVSKMNARPAQNGSGSLPDPLIDEIRQIRREISERFGNDVRRLAEHLREVQRHSKVPVRRRSPPEKRDTG